MNMKKNKRISSVGCIVLLLLCGFVYEYMHTANKFHLEVIQVENNGFGYKIYEKERLIIIQPFVPTISGKRAFKNKQDAGSVGSLVLERIKAGEDFAISNADLNNLGITY